ncbi:hypothetical protein GCM10007159_38630 [Modicisalibacter luteus]|nr:hypothetical protein GCM10007159_38630 [Halomonas lutea]
MTVYKLPCTDGTDRNCHRIVEVDLGIVGLSNLQLSLVRASINRYGGANVELTSAQVAASTISLSSAQLADLERNGTVVFWIEPEGLVCAFCGSH